MEAYYSEWRRRLAVHAALLLLFSIALGFQYRVVLEHDDPLHCAGIAQPNYPNELNTPYDINQKRICAPGKQKEDWACEFDDPCLPDTVIEHRWRSAHQQGLLHALLLLGVAIAAPYFRVGCFMFGFAGWLIIVGVWAAPLGATIQAWGTKLTKQATMYCAVTPESGELVITHCMANTIGAVAGISTTIAILILGLRGAWEVIRDGVAPTTWRNWARIVKARPRRIETPRIPEDTGSTQEIEDIVDRAIWEKTTVRAFGGRYSWSAIAPTDGVMVDMREINRVFDPVPTVGPDAERAAQATHTVRVRAGARIRDLTDRLMDHGLMLQTSPVIPWIQVGGALANGCHGTGVGHAPLTDLVVSMEIVQTEIYNGTFRAVNRTYDRPTTAFDDSDPAWNEWQALMVNLGCLGVMHTVTFECVPIYDVHIFDTSMDMRSTIDDPNTLRQIVHHPPVFPVEEHNRYAELFWFPFNDEIFVRSWQPEPPASPRRDFSLWFWLKQWLVAKIIGPIVFVVMGLLPFLTPFLMKIFHMAFGSTDAHVSAPNAMQYERFFMRVYDMGYAIGYDPDIGNPNGFDTFRRAWWQVVEKLENARHQGSYPQNLVLHVRFGRESRAFLHPNRGSEFTAYMEVVTHVNASRQQEHFEMIERIWHRLGGKPHWGKVTYQPDRNIDNYNPLDATRFRNQRDRMDPGEVFLNDYVRRVLHE